MGRPVIPDEVTDEQIEQVLARRKLQRDQQILNDASTNSSTGVVQTEAQQCCAVGPTLYVDVLIEGVLVHAMVDTGAQSTIIARSVLHDIGRRRSQEGQPLPTLKIPTVKLFGKDGADGGHQLEIVAQLDVTLELDDKRVSVPVFVQPNSSQICLLGMNAIPHLGIKVTRANGEVLCDQPEGDLRIARVSLLSAVSIPSNRGCCLEAKVDNVPGGTDILFEPKHEVLKGFGVSMQESLLSTRGDGTVLIPIENFQVLPAKLAKGIDIGVASVITLDSSVAHYMKPHRVESHGENSTCCVVETDGKRFKTICSELKLEGSGYLTASETDIAKTVLSSYQDVFALSDGELGCTDLVQHHVETGEHAPIRQYPYRTPVCRRSQIEEMVNSMQTQGVVKPSASPWSSPIVLVPKKDGTLRFCVDYRRLNSITRKDVYPLPRIDDILDTLGGAQYFSSLDLASGYWQVPIDPASIPKTAFTTHHGLYEFVRMPFGLCNAPATFQRLMRTVLAGLDWCSAYLDDILIVSTTFEEHLERLQEVLTRLRTAGLRLKPQKCHLFTAEVRFLGHVISKDGIRPDPAKTERVKEFPHPTDVASLRQFLGLASYYRRFVPGFSKIAAPLNSLTKKNTDFFWTAQCEAAFTQLQDLLTTAPVLAYPRFGSDTGFILETDASYVGLGVVLSQEQENGEVHPIAYASRSLDCHEKNYGISELETLGLVWAVRYFRAYLLGHPCTVYTDHAACLSILNTARPSGKLARWALTIQEMDLTIKHKAGKNNSNADALSRNPCPSSPVSAVESVTTSESEVHIDTVELQAKQKSDPELAAMINYLTEGVLPADDKFAKRIVFESSRYEMIDGILNFENPAFPGRQCVVVPKCLREAILTEAHASCFGGHFSERKVLDKLRRFVWWKGLRGDVKRFCRSCLTCSTRKGRQRTFRPYLQPISVGGPFHRVAVDILQLPLTVNGNKYVIVFMDYLTKWAEAFAIPDQRSETFARLFVDNIICRHGIPEELLSDRGANFLSDLILSICETFGVKKINTSGYHPRTDGLVEKFNSTLINLIAKCCESKNNDWDEYLPMLLFAYRSSIQESTRETPFYLLHGRDPRIPTSTVLSQTRSTYCIDHDDYKSELAVRMAECWKLARDNITKAQATQKKKYDSKRSVVDLKVGERVMVYMPSEVQGRNRKLARPFHGPYRVLSVTPTNVEVQLVEDPKGGTIFVSLDRVRRCYPELRNTTWTGPRKKRKRSKKFKKSTETQNTEVTRVTGPVTRSMTRQQSEN